MNLLSEEKTKIAIVIATYYRPDGQTKFFIERALNSLNEQSLQNFKIFLIGDKYEPINEFIEYNLIHINTCSENLLFAKEREKYTGKNLWCYGGVHAFNYGIMKALSEGYEWIINMDHDDYFLPTHIQDITNLITENCVFVCSKSSWKNISILPNTNDINYIPYAEKLVKSSACVNFKKTNILFKDLYEEKGIVYPSDADFWNRLNKIIIDNKYDSFCTCKTTCIHDQEAYTISAFK